MTWAWLLSPCLFVGHETDPLLALRGKALHRECRRCQADLGVVLPGQKYRARKEKKITPKKLARVMTLTRKAG